MKQKKIEVGQVLHGFLVKRIVDIKNHIGIFYELEHKKTGAECIHLANDDTENGFCVAFKTIPEDSTGVLHILEHTVLTGSEKYPVRDPFFGMIKRSLKTFMNAMTSSAWTAYPFATENKKDYYNILDVYLDAVYFSKISELNFKQEGHRLEFNKETGKLEFNGVVYGEMKGAMSAEDQVIYRGVRSFLLPSGACVHNSGGDPRSILDLSYEQLKMAYARFYHPSNSYIFTYGNFPLKERLSAIDKVLSKFKKIDPCIEVVSEKRWEAPREIEVFYPVNESEDISNKYMSGLAWLTCYVDEPLEILSLEFLNNVLLGNLEAPLYKALIESGLGSSLFISGFDAGYRDCSFYVTLRGVKKENAEKVRALILDTLRDLAENGIDRELIDATFDKFKIDNKKMSCPYFLKLFHAFGESWMYGGDPLIDIDTNKNMEELRKKIDEGFLEKQIDKYFLSNTHRISFLCSPDKDMTKNFDNWEQKKLKDIQIALTDEEEALIRKTSCDLEDLQNTKEDLSCLPTLELSDIPSSIKTSKGVRLHKNKDIIRYKKNTNGLCHIKIAFEFDITRIDPEVLPFFSLFCAVLPTMGTNNFSTQEMIRKISRYTGRVGAGKGIERKLDSSRELIGTFSLNASFLPENKDHAFDIVRELLTCFSFDDLSSLKSSILRMRDGMSSGVIKNGHGFAKSLAVRGFDLVFELEEMWEGIHQLQFLKELALDLGEEKLRDISKKLKYLARLVINESKINIVIVADSNREIKQLSALAIDLKKSIPHEYSGIYFANNFKERNIKECWVTSTNALFVADCFRVPNMLHDDAPILNVIAVILKGCFVHQEIREKGGAYGGLVFYNKSEGVFAFVSYRDKQITRTINTFRGGATDYILGGYFSSEDIREAVLQICSVMGKPNPPYIEAFEDFYRKKMGISDKMREEYQKRLLNITKDDIIKVAKKYFTEDNLTNRSLAVISSENKIEEENKKMDVPLEVKKI